MLRKCLFSLAGIVALALLVVSIAAADPPTRTYSAQTPFSGTFCPGFDVLDPLSLSFLGICRTRHAFRVSRGYAPVGLTV
jgi:hypothetical protein